jgi:DNA-binding transcriptional regulator YbjK
MIVTTAGTLVGMAYAAAIDTNEREDLVQSWRRADRNLIDANRDGDSWRS